MAVAVPVAAHEVAAVVAAAAPEDGEGVAGVRRVAGRHGRPGVTRGRHGDGRGGVLRLAV